MSYVICRFCGVVRKLYHPCSACGRPTYTDVR